MVGIVEFVGGIVRGRGERTAEIGAEVVEVVAVAGTEAEHNLDKCALNIRILS